MKRVVASFDRPWAEDYKELIPRGLPRDFDQYYPLRQGRVSYTTGGIT